MTQGVSPSMWTAAAAVAVAIAGAADSRRAAISGGIAGIACMCLHECKRDQSNSIAVPRL